MLQGTGALLRIAKGLNRLMGRRGPVFEDHYHSRVVRTPTQAALVLAYVLGNFARHAMRWGEHVDPKEVDPFGSAAAATGLPLVAPPGTWLLTVGWKCARGVRT